MERAGSSNARKGGGYKQVAKRKLLEEGVEIKQSGLAEFMVASSTITIDRAV